MSFTREEHIARAMLLGRVYDRVDGTYCVTFDGKHLSDIDMLDCITLQPVTVLEVSKRIKVGHPKGSWEL